MSFVNRFREIYSFDSIISLDLTLDLSQEIRLTHITKKKSLVSILDNKTFINIDTADEYIKTYKGLPISLYIQGKGVITKMFSCSDIHKTELTTQEIQSIFPSYLETEFYISQLKGLNYIWIALIKKETLSSFLNELAKKKISPIQIFIGPFILSNILKQLNFYNNVFLFANHRIEVNNEGLWTDYQYSIDYINSFTIKVDNTIIEQEFIASYAAAFSTLMSDYLPNRAIYQSEIQLQLTEAKEKIKFKKNSIIISISFFLILLINAIIFNNLYKTNTKLESTVATQTISENQLIKIRDQTIISEQKIEELGWNGGINKSYLLNQIGLSLNTYPSIEITKLFINPENTKIKTAIAHDERNTILIIGRVSNLSILNKWIIDLQQLTWVKLARIDKFSISDQSLDQDLNIFKIRLEFNYEF